MKQFVYSPEIEQAKWLAISNLLLILASSDDVTARVTTHGDFTKKTGLAQRAPIALVSFRILPWIFQTLEKALIIRKIDTPLQRIDADNALKLPHLVHVSWRNSITAWYYLLCAYCLTEEPGYTRSIKITDLPDD